MKVNKGSKLKLQMILSINQNTPKIFYIVIFINMIVRKRCAPDLISPENFLQLLKRINLNLSVILLYSNLRYTPLLTQLVPLSTKLKKVVAKWPRLQSKKDHTIRDTLSFPD